MTTLHNILSQTQNERYATDTGRRIHTKLQHIIIDSTTERGNIDLIKKIKNTANLAQFFTANAKTELPIAGTINDKFISRRLDRVLINHDTHTIQILDYKTDTDRTARYNQYTKQIHEYTCLLRKIYPEYKTTAYILWTHDFLLEKLPVKPL